MVGKGRQSSVKNSAALGPNQVTTSLPEAVPLSCCLLLAFHRHSVPTVQGRRKRSESELPESDQHTRALVAEFLGLLGLPVLDAGLIWRSTAPPGT